MDRDLLEAELALEGQQFPYYGGRLRNYHRDTRNQTMCRPTKRNHRFRLLLVVVIEIIVLYLGVGVVTHHELQRLLQDVCVCVCCV